MEPAKLVPDQSNLIEGDASGSLDLILYPRRWLVLLIFSLITMTNEVIWISLSSVSSIIKDYYQVK